ncbi:hypothetical protein ASPZODRAFT_62885 [Penicilliopsis zonata CBS 506.65]|uniref:HypA-like protein n=1 Tax=Penicilliopsis zonata CBS 506.65 TaxID=1073090 RepID=A0A1L9SNA8_9EURO|nr:hypothetical protein ASPZODRAFT_62885 [Penicilliopsis zonata CBS 506.65]OJJ48527.1 hypothetical protein ASPZODRAFT_62885 [Penicilliopsis zonata CBS 506.65]
MATSSRVFLSPVDTGVFSTAPRADAAKTATEVLQKNLEKHHIYFNNRGFHNHIVHHILTIYALGASPAAIQEAYQRNASYQRPVLPVTESVAHALHDRATFIGCLGREEHYPNFLAFFQVEIANKGVEHVLNEYLFAEDERAEDLLIRLFSGLLHPIIHLGFGVEFNQPAIVAEALAQTAIHDDWIGPMFLLPAETAAGGVGKRGDKSLFEILQEASTDRKLVDSVRWSDDNNMRDGVLTRAPAEMIAYASQFTVSKDQIKEKHAEILNTTVYFTAAAQKPDKEIKMDFFFLHCVTSSIFLSKFLAMPSLSLRAKLRLLEWKGRMDLLVYVSRNSPKLTKERITAHHTNRNWDVLFAKGIAHPEEDGHLVKLLRAVAHAEKVCRPLNMTALPVSDDMWLKIGNMIVDSVSDDPMYIFSTGFDEAWVGFKSA